jgi:fluoride exporter
MGTVATYLWIAIGSALGGMARYACAVAIATRFGAGFPLGTLVINILGSFIIGFFSALTGPGGRLAVSSNVSLFVTVGICGGYTTFSSFSLQTLALAQGGHLSRAGLNIIASVALCLIAVWIGYVAAGSLNALKS